jgi:predicted amidohydrolase
MTGRRVRAACVQFTASDVVEDNIATASALIAEAKAAGAGFVATPEVTSLMERRSPQVWEKTSPQDRDPALAAFRRLAADLGIWLLVGSLPIRIADARLANRSFLLTPDGGIAATYDKIHMFDVTLPNGETSRESKNYQAGDRAVMAATPWGALGLTICYDLRFPYLYRTLAQAGAEILTVPAAFTRITGEAHWHVLLRARAIETGSFVVAPGMCGDHSDGRKTFGHSLIVDPWGEVLADGGPAPGIVVADLDLDKVADVRSKIPALTADRVVRPPRVPLARSAE